MLAYESRLRRCVELIEEPCACGSNFRCIRDVQGRLDDIFVYAGGTSVHPHVFRSVLARNSEVVEYQVQQTESGATVAVTVSSPIDEASLRSQLESALKKVGVGGPQVDLSCVASLGRGGVGKLKRFVSLSPG